MASRPSALDPGQIRFYDNFVPRLHDGKHEISVSQRLTGATAETFEASQRFEVYGPRWRVPANLIHSAMPPPNHSGRFEEQLPQIVLKKRTLPWERFLNAGDPDAPWMGLLLFDAGAGAQATATVTDGAVTGIEIQAAGAGYELAPAVRIEGGGGSGATALASTDAGGTVIGIQVTCGGSGYGSAPKVVIGSPSNAATVTLAEVLKPGRDALGNPIAAPDIQLNPDFDQPADGCQVIDVPVANFIAQAPRYRAGATDELKYCAHVRQVHTGDKEPLGMKRADGWFAVLIAKRFPRARAAASNRQIAHLVSFEGYADRLTGQASAFGTSVMLRLVSLANWTFTCLPDEGETFGQLMRDLLASEDHGDYLLRPRYDAPDFEAGESVQTARRILDLGYTPLGYQTRQGERTFAWYRGPLSPVLPPAFSDQPHLASPSGSVIYDPQAGLFDQSYAVAFQTARLLALSSRSFGGNLLKWRREAHQLVNLLIERLPSVDMEALKGLDAVQARQILEQDVVSQAAMAWLVDDFTKRIAPGLSRPAKLPNAPQHLVQDDADQAVADLQQALATPEFRQLLRDLNGWDAAGGSFANPRLQRICEWLARLVLLEGMPFHNLVPSSNMLPKSAIRFFYLDPNITRVLIDGAMSVAGQTSRDTLYYAIMRDVIREAVLVLIHQVRANVLGVSATPPLPGDQPISGLLLRSPAVSGWPGLEVKAFASVDRSGPTPRGQDSIPLLRMQRLGADVLLVLFPRIPAWVQIDEPKEGLAFGIEDAEQNNANPIWIRHLTGGSVGRQFGTDPATDAIDASPAIDQDSGLVDLLEVRQLLVANPALAVELRQKPVAPGELTPGDFALQLVKLPERMIFAIPSN